MGLSGAQRLFNGRLKGIVEAARLADGAGVGAVHVSDHVVMGPHIDEYPYGRFPRPLDEPWPDPLVVLSGIAGATSNLRLCTTILIATVRPAPLLAKMAATLDGLSDGRLDLGVGTGWQRDELEACGVPFKGRVARLEDAIGACRALWESAPASFSSGTVTFEDLWCLPAPVQKRLPVWLPGQPTPAVAERIARLGDGWAPMPGTPLEDITTGARLLREAFEGAGRDPSSVKVRADLVLVRDGDGRVRVRESIEKGLPPLEQVGVTYAAFSLDRCVGDAAAIQPFLAELSEVLKEAGVGLPVSAGAQAS
jgi:probable F420-dependent oxidoreductase